ncbi:MAG TPA: hypothetical protein VNX27_06515 [Chthoniobacterales bacterium]|jgi:hypothetical protein|nr:hypothetical protein [Chthoniobacterales bacterium]
MKRTTHLLAFAGVAYLAICLSLASQTMPRNSGLSASASPIQRASSSPTLSPANQNPRPLPFHGMVSAVDQKNKTFTISGKEARRVFKVTSKTQIIKGSGIVTMKDIVDNEEVSGSYWKNADGTLEAKVVKLGPMEKKTASPAAKTSPSLSPGPSTSPKL